jgi:hypothetical protein
MEQPVDEEYREMLKQVAQALDEFFNRDMNNKTVAFTLLIAPFGKAEGGRVNYVSNADRRDNIQLMEELLARWKGMAGHQRRLSVDQVMDILAGTRRGAFKPGG